MKYLKDEQYYIDLYDLSTIKSCLKVIESWRNAYSEHLNDEDTKKFSPGDKAKGFNWITNQEIFQIIGRRYKDKEETIKEWMDDDRIKQDKFDDTPEPKNTLCPNCKKLMHLKIKHLDTLAKPLCMMFLFECSVCKKKFWINEDGKERPSTPTLCTKCKAETEITVIKETKDSVKWKSTCSSCGFTETTIDDFKKSRIERENKEKEEKILLEKHRTAYCSDEEGKKALEYIEALPVAAEVFKEQLKKFDSLAYQKVSHLKKINVIELERILNETFEKENYIKLSFEKPEIGQHVIVSFTLQDADASRIKDKSVTILQKLIKDTLEDTNWRLMSDGLSYRLGYISGRLKGYENEDDLFELSGQKKEEEILNLDHDTRMKHMSHNVVQLAKFMGEFKGIQNVRERRLKKEPEGFFLDSPEESYQCGICGESSPGNKTWWNLDGVRCSDCQRNINEDIIPAEIHKNDDICIKDWELSSEYEFNIHPSTVRKLRKEGILHGRDLKREDGTVYFTVYLNDENKKFLKKYSRKPRQRMVITDLLGNKVEI